MKIKAKLLDSIFCTSLLLAVAWPGATNAAQQAAPAVNWQTEYLPTKVELRMMGGVLFRFSERAGLKVVTEFNADNTPHFVQDNHSQAKSYEYDGRKHVVAIHRGTIKDGVFTEDASKLTSVAYDDQYRNAFVLSNGKAITVSLSRAHIRNAPQPSSSVRLVKNTAQYAGTILINGTQQLVYVIPVAVTPTAFVEIKSKRASTLILLVPTYAQHILLR